MYTSQKPQKQRLSFKSILLNPNFMFAVWMLIALAAYAFKFRLGPGHYNNYLVFKGTIANLMAGNSLYAPQPELYNDLNHYGPCFAMLIAPFAALPDWLGLLLWVMVSTLLLYFALRSLPIEPQWQAAGYWISSVMLYSALVMQQFNVLTAALLILSFVMIERRKEGWAALFIVIGAFVKIYGIVGLAFFFFVKRKPRFVLHLLIWSAVAFALPMLFADPAYVIRQYAEWFSQLQIKTIQNQLSFYQNISLLGMVRKTTGNLQYSDVWIMLGGAALFLLAYLRTSQYKFVDFRMMLLSSVMILTVLMSSSSENSGYIIASVGVGIWLGATPARRGFVTWALVALVVLSSFAVNLLPRRVYMDYFFAYSLRALPFALVWLRICYELYFLDFYKKTTRYF